MTEAPHDIALHRIAFDVCDLCLTAAGGECHVPGCVFWMDDAPIGSWLAWLRERRAEPSTEAREAIELIEIILAAETEPCRYDHNDVCQAHYMNTRPCPVERARVLLASRP